MGLEEARAAAAALEKGEDKREEPKAAPQRSGWLGAARGEYDAINAGLLTLHKQFGRGLEKVFSAGGRAPLAGAVFGSALNPVPGDIPEALLMAVTADLPVSEAGSDLTKIAKQALKTGAAGAGIYGTEAAITGKPIGERMTEGAIEGITGGAVKGTADVISYWRQPQEARRAIAGIRAFKQANEISPAVRAVLDEKNPRSFFDPASVREMAKRASDIFDAKIKTIARVADVDRKFLLKSIQLPPELPAPPDKVNAIRSVKWMTPDPANPVAHPYVTVEEAQKFIASLRKVKEFQLARVAELDLESQLERIAPGLGEKYEQAVVEYTLDHDGVKTIRGIQGIYKLPGGGSPVTHPKLAEASRAVGVETTPQRGAKTQSDTLVNTLLGASHPTSFYGAGHAAAALRDAVRATKRLVDPTKIQPPKAWRTIFAPLQLPGAKGAAGARAVEAAGEAMRSDTEQQ